MQRHSQAFDRKARFAKAISRFFMVVAVLGPMMILFSILGPKGESVNYDYVAQTEEARERAKQVEALIESRENMTLIVFSSFSLVCFFWRCDSPGNGLVQHPNQ